jgi:hypothetical protein
VEKMWLQSNLLRRFRSACSGWKVFPTWSNTIVTFADPNGKPEVAGEQVRFVFHKWLREKLQNGEFVARPKSQLVEGGLGGIQNALDDLKKGVSGIKYVVEV